jgi:hypothetical protein
VVVVSDYKPSTADLSLDPAALRGTCYRYPDRPPILTLHGEGWSLTITGRSAIGPAAIQRDAERFAQIVSQYADAASAWADQQSATAPGSAGSCAPWKAPE